MGNGQGPHDSQIIGEQSFQEFQVGDGTRWVPVPKMKVRNQLQQFNLRDLQRIVGVRVHVSHLKEHVGMPRAIPD